MDNLLKCPICFDFFDTALMLITCSHNFCSLCIKKYFSQSKLHCPICRKSASTYELRNNRLLDELVICLKSSLDKHCSINNTNNCISNRNSNSNSLSNSTKLQDDDDFIVSTQPTYAAIVKKRSSSSSISSSQPLSNNGSNSDKKLKIDNQSQSLSPTHSQTPTIMMTRSRSQKVGIKYDDSILDSSTMTKRKGRSPTKTSPSSSPSKTVKESKTGDKLQCPFCQNHFDPSVIDGHIQIFHPDGANSQQDAPKINDDKDSDIECTQQSASQYQNSINNNNNNGNQLVIIQPKRLMPLAKLCYSIMKVKQIKDALKNLGLKTNGDRQALINRHKEYTLRHNSQCDSLNPKTTEEIIKELYEYEQYTSKPSSSKKKQQQQSPLALPQPIVPSSPATPILSLTSSSSSTPNNDQLFSQSQSSQSHSEELFDKLKSQILNRKTVNS